LRWGDVHRGKYAPVTESVTLDGAYEPIVSPKLWARVQERLAKIGRKRYARRADFPLRGLLVCQHCGRLMHGYTVRRDGRVYQRYACSQYRGDRHLAEGGCGHFTVPADLVLKWLTRALQELLLGPARSEVIDALERHFDAPTKAAPETARTHEKRLGELDRRINRLRRAVARIDDDGLVEELRQAKADRARVEAEAAEIGQVTDARAQAARLVDQAWALGEKLGTADPAILREVFGQLVSRITCQWDTTTTPSGRTRAKLVEGRVELRDNPLLRSLSRGVAYAEAWER
jgi:hypothetical protein